MYTFIAPTAAAIFVDRVFSLIVYSSIIALGVLSTSILLQCGKCCKRCRREKKAAYKAELKPTKLCSPVPSIPYMPTPALERDSGIRQSQMEEAKAKAVDEVVEKENAPTHEQQPNPQPEPEQVMQSGNDEEEYNSCPDLTPDKLHKLAQPTPA